MISVVKRILHQNSCESSSPELAERVRSLGQARPADYM